MSVVDLSDYLRNGMARSHRIPANSPYLKLCSGLQPTEFGLRSFMPFTSPDLAGMGITASWPWPQLVVGRRVILLINNNTIYELDRNTLAPTTITVRNWTLYDHSSPASYTTLAVPTGTQHWQFADLNDSWMLTRNGCTIFKTAINSAVFGVTTPTIECAASHMESRLFLGNFINQLAAQNWKTWAEAFQEYAPTLYRGLGAAMDKSWVWWSSVNAPDMLLFIDQTLSYKARPYMSTPPAKETGFGGSGEKQYIMHLLRQNQMGGRPMPWKGKVLGFHEMDSGMLVFGEDGVCALTPYENTYGLKLIDGLPLGLGARSRDAWAGNKQSVLFCDKAGKLWEIDAQLHAKEVDYEYAVNDLSASTFHMNFEERRKEYWLADGSISQCLTGTGFTHAPKMPTSIINYGTGGVGVWIDTLSPTEASFTTSTITAKTAQMQEGRTFVVKSVRLKYEATTGATVRAILYWRMTNTEAFTATNYVTFDDNGVAPFGIRCKECRVHVHINDRTLVDGAETLQLEVLQDGAFNVNVTKSETAPTLPAL